MINGWHCTAPKIWPPEEGSSFDAAIDIDVCWATFDTAEGREVHVVADHPEWHEAITRKPLGSARSTTRSARAIAEPPKVAMPLAEPPVPPVKVRADQRSMACYGCGQMKDCLPTTLSDGTAAWMCDTCPDPTLRA